MILQKKLVLSILLFCVSLHAQKISIKSYQNILKSTYSVEQVQRSTDSILNTKNLSNSDKSYIYHTYARFLFRKNKKKLCYDYLLKAIELRKINQANDLIALKKSLFNLGLYNKRDGFIYKSINAFNQLIHLPNEGRLCSKAYSELITLNYKVGDFKKSMDYFNKSTAYYISNNDYRNLYKNYMRMAKVYMLMDSKKYNSDIITFLKKAYSLKDVTEIDSKDLVLINLDFGNVYRKLKQNKKALQHYQKALMYSKKLNDSSTIAMINNNIGDFYIKEQVYDKAKISLEESLLFAKNTMQSKVLTYSTYGEYYNKLKDFDKAQYYYEKAIQLLIFNNESKNYQNPTTAQLSLQSNKLRLFDFISQKARYWKKRYDIEPQQQFLINALHDYKLADQLLDMIRFESSEKTSKLFWREKGATLYIQAVEVCYTLKDLKSAYFFMEKNKALLLLEELSDQQAKVLSNLPQQLIERDFSFKQKIVATEEATISNKANRVFEIKRNYEKFKDSIATHFPAYSKLKKTLPVLNLKEHKAHYINPKTATLQFILNANKAYALLLTDKEDFFYPIDDLFLLKDECIYVTQQLQHPFNTTEDVAIYAKNANSIFNKIIPNHIFKKLNGKKITIAADGVLQNIPFEALISNINQHDSYLIKNNEFNYVYSFSYLLSNNSKQRKPKHLFLGFAPEKFSNHSLANLPNSIPEITCINAMFNDQVFTNEQATKKNFIANFGNYKIVHLATHSGSKNAEKPWLAFRQHNVNLNEIYATQNQADLVVLSACKTSQGVVKTGEGVMSLARGFFFSGTNSVIATLWNINDKTTQQIMHSFYANIKNGATKSKALHDAKLNYLSSHTGSLTSPYYWSSFILIGDSGIITIPENQYWLLIIILSIIAFLIAFTFKRIKKK